ncbi:MAG TPA: hypothetical protein VK907_14500 [Phnomibacter sp.]|nr:hypothetical protein [Phnomibacter sp.]
MPTIILRHKVGDINTWLKGHQDRIDLLGPAITSFKTFQDADDPNSVLLLCEVTDMEKLGAVINDPEVQAAKDRHTVLEPIIMSMQVDL